MFHKLDRLNALGFALACAGCSSSSSGGAATASSGPCDPLSPPPTTLGAILGA